jgi:thiol:disulfide interchange protein DsbC
MKRTYTSFSSVPRRAKSPQAFEGRFWLAGIAAPFFAGSLLLAAPNAFAADAPPEAPACAASPAVKAAPRGDTALDALTDAAKATPDITGRLKSASENFKARYPKIEVASFRLTPVAGLYEAVVKKEVVYFDESARFLFSGRLLDMQKGEDVTRARLEEIRRVPFESLPLADAVVTVNGTGARRLAVFTDVDCPYSRRLSETLKGLKDTTVYTFLFPLESIHPKARATSEAVLCSPNPEESLAKALKGEAVDKEAMCGTEEKKSKAESILTRTLQRATKEGIAGTPTLINEAGERSAGALTPEALEAFVQKGFEAANKAPHAKAPSLKAPETASRDSKETKPQGAE